MFSLLPAVLGHRLRSGPAYRTALPSSPRLQFSIARAVAEVLQLSGWYPYMSSSSPFLWPSHDLIVDLLPLRDGLRIVAEFWNRRRQVGYGRFDRRSPACISDKLIGVEHSASSLTTWLTRWLTG